MQMRTVGIVGLDASGRVREMLGVRVGSGYSPICAPGAETT